MKKTFVGALFLLASLTAFAQDLSIYSVKPISPGQMSMKVFDYLGFVTGTRVRYCHVVDKSMYRVKTFSTDVNDKNVFTLKLARKDKIVEINILRDGKVYTSPSGLHIMLEARSEPTFSGGLRTYKELRLDIDGYTQKALNLVIVTKQSNQAGQTKIVESESISCR